MYLALLTLPAFAADNLRLNDHLDYTSDSHDGPLITGDHLDAGPSASRPTYVIIYGEGCYNSKRQARRTVELYEKYKGRVDFVVVDLDQKRAPAHEELVKKYYKGYIPHVVVLDAAAKPLYNSSGEVEQSVISAVLEKALK
jgi:thioredoxin-like negative regulator of GroEL